MTDDDFARMPDLWYEHGEGRVVKYWCIEGVWHYRIEEDDGNVLSEGVGAP